MERKVGQKMREILRRHCKIETRVLGALEFWKESQTEWRLNGKVDIDGVR